jgi:hypothetical protein
MPRAPVDVERLRLSTRAIQRDHQLPPELFAERVFGDQGFELADQRGVPAEGELRPNPLLDRRQPNLLQTRDCALREGLVREIG